VPIYEYQCKACGAVSEIFTNVSAHSDALACKSCGGTELEKLLSTAAIPTLPARPAGKTCCGRDEQCGGLPGGKTCCSQ
jgi:putative FmdB family regulatory protein